MGSATQTRYGAAESSGRTDILSPLEQHSRASESFVSFVGVCQSAPHQSPAVRSRFLEGCLVVFPSSSSSIVVVVHRPSSSSSSVVVVVHRRRRRCRPSSSIVVIVVHRRRHHTSSPSHIAAVAFSSLLSCHRYLHPRLIFVRHCVIAAYLPNLSPLCHRRLPILSPLSILLLSSCPRPPSYTRPL